MKTGFYAFKPWSSIPAYFCLSLSRGRSAATILLLRPAQPKQFSITHIDLTWGHQKPKCYVENNDGNSGRLSALLIFLHTPSSLPQLRSLRKKIRQHWRASRAGGSFFCIRT